MKNPRPTKRARRIEMRRKELGADRCFYCTESNHACLELDHPVGEKRDDKFKRADCRNCHRKVEFNRDLYGLTNNGIHKRHESKRESHISYLLLLALDQESIAEALESPNVSLPLVAAALRSTAASLRRQTLKLQQRPRTNSSRTRRSKSHTSRQKAEQK